MTTVRHHFDQLAPIYDQRKKNFSFYYDELKRLLADFIPPSKKVLEIGCGTGELLASLYPKNGYGIDISSKMVELASSKYRKNKKLQFRSYNKFPQITFDYIFMSDVVEHLVKPGDTFKWIASRMNQKTLFICTMANPKWESLLLLAEKLKLKMPEGEHHRSTFYQLKKLLQKADMQIVKHDFRLLVPINIPVITKLINEFIEPYFKRYAFIEFFIAKKSPRFKSSESKPSHL